MSADAIYLDCNATTPILPEVADAMREAAARYAGNPASQHEAGRQARRALETARQLIGELLGANMAGRDADQVIFTSGGTEANNLAVFGFSERAGSSPTPAPLRLVISALEHPSVSRAAEHLAAQDVSVDVIGVDARGVVKLDHARELIERQNAPPALVCVMLASNETGVVQPIEAIAALSRERGVVVHTDATQAVGKIAVDFRALGVDALTCTAHKLHGPLGVGALLLRHGVALAPQLHGGFQQAALRPGTESVALAFGFAAALEAWQREAVQRESRMRQLRDRLESLILTGCDAAVVLGADAPRLPHTANIAFRGYDRQALAMALDLAGVACSTGSACASGSSEPSPALLAMGLPQEQISGSLRFSLGALTTAAEIDEAARRILSVCNQLRRQ